MNGPAPSDTKRVEGPAPRREIYAWGMYDFANSAFATSIFAVIFNGYYVKHVVPEGHRPGGDQMWNYAASIAALIVFFSAPVVGAICDFTAAKKTFAAAFWIVGCLATAALYFVQPGMAIFGAAVFIVGFYAFESSVAVTNAFLPELTTPEKTNRDSGIAWAMGYIGGGLCLILNLFMVERGLVRESFAVVGAWWFFFSLPFFLMVRERATPRRPPGSLVAAGFGRVFRTFRDVRANREVFKFMIAFLLLNAGLISVIANAGPFAQAQLGFTQKSIILVFLMIQAVAAPGALAFGWIADQFGGRRTLAWGLLLWIGTCAWALTVSTQKEFWFLGALVALVMGGTQSVCRAMVAHLAPAGQQAEYYGLFAVFGRLAESIGLFLYGYAIALSHHPRAGIASTGLLFLAGLIVLSAVKLPDERPADVVRDRRAVRREFRLRLLRCLFLLFFRSLHGFSVRGEKNVPEKGPFILAANHPSYFDPILVALASNRFVRYFALQEVVDFPIVGWFARQFGVLPVTPKEGSEASVQKAIRILQRGGIVGIFPEGKRSDQRLMGPVRRGLGRLMAVTGVPVVPVTIEGAYESWSKRANTPRPFRIEITFHPPVQLSEDERRGREDDRDFHQSVADRVAEIVRNADERPATA